MIKEFKLWSKRYNINDLNISNIRKTFKKYMLEITINKNKSNIDYYEEIYKQIFETRDTILFLTRTKMSDNNLHKTIAINDDLTLYLDSETEINNELNLIYSSNFNFSAINFKTVIDELYLSKSPIIIFYSKESDQLYIPLASSIILVFRSIPDKDNFETIHKELLHETISTSPISTKSFNMK